MIDKKKLKDVMKKQDLKQEKPTDPSMKTTDLSRKDMILFITKKLLSPYTITPEW